LAEDREKQIKASKEPQKPVRPKIQVDSLKNMLSEVLLNKGNLFFSELDVPDSAAFYYNRIINEFDSSEYLPNAFYNLGSYYLSIANKTRGDSLFNYVYNTFPDHPFAEAAAIKLGFLIEEKKDDPSENDFEFIDNLISEHKFDSVLIKSDEIINKYPKTQAAAKSIFIKGWIFENKLEKPDSAISNYRKLIAEFRTTEFTRTITPKVREWDKDVKEKERRLKAVQDSVANAALPDSLKNQNKNLKAPNTKKEQNVEKISEPKENPNSQQIPFPEPPNAQKPDSTKIISDNKVNRIEMFKTKNVNTVLDSLKNTPIPTDSTKGK
jgi:tetratricopeptide (TPR) repeat protein